MNKNENPIFALFKQGYTMEDIEDLMVSAHADYEEEKAELARKEQEKKFKEQKIAEAREALGAAIIEYYSAIGKEVNEYVIKNVDHVMDILPRVDKAFLNKYGTGVVTFK